MAENTTSGAAGTGKVAAAATAGAGLILFTLAAGQFLMALDSSVMNVSIATVAEDLGTSVQGVQTAITLYTLVMASLMILGGKIGGMIGRKRAFSIGCVIYGCGSLTTALAPNLTVLIIGWSFIEGIGAILIMPAIVGLVASNFPPQGRPRAYGLVAAAAAIAIAVGPVIGGFMTTYFSWRYVFAGEVIVVIAILFLARRAADEPVGKRPHLDLAGVVVSSAGPGARRARRAHVVDLGMVPAQGGSELVPRSLAHHLVHHGGPLPPLAVPALAAASRAHRQGAAHRPVAVQPPAAHGRAHHLPVPVPDPGGGVLHRAAVPLGGARALAHGDGHAAGAALAGAARRRRRRPQVPPAGQSAARRARRPAGADRRARRADRQPRGRRRLLDRVRARWSSSDWASGRSRRSWAM